MEFLHDDMQALAHLLRRPGMLDFLQNTLEKMGSSEEKEFDVGEDEELSHKKSLLFLIVGEGRRIVGETFHWYSKRRRVLKTRLDARQTKRQLVTEFLRRLKTWSLFDFRELSFLSLWDSHQSQQRARVRAGRWRHPALLTRTANLYYGKRELLEANFPAHFGVESITNLYMSEVYNFRCLVTSSEGSQGFITYTWYRVFV